MPLRDEGLVMDSFEWAELETVTGEIAHSQRRLDGARSSQDYRLVKILESELAEAKERRARLLAHITTNLAASPRATPHAIHSTVSDVRVEKVEQEQKIAEQVDHITASGITSPDAASSTATIEGATIIWDQLKTADIERIKHDLNRRRAEMLSRHAEELKSLETDLAEIDVIDKAIDAIAQKFKVAGAEVVALNEERGSRSQTQR